MSNVERFGILNHPKPLQIVPLRNCVPAAQLGLHVEIPFVRGLGLIGLVGWSALWVLVARRLGRSGQLTGDNDVY